MKTLHKHSIQVLVAFLTLFVFQVNAQTPPNPTTPISTPTDLDVGTISSGATMVTVVDGAVLFYNPATNGPSITLQASTDDGNGNTFSSYEWYTVAEDDTETVVAGETAASLSLTSLAPGYHKYRVYGLADFGGGTITCQSDEYQDIILFVLSPLTVETTANLNGNPQEFCTNDLPATPINLSVSDITADYSANTNGYANPAGSDFEVTYAWFAVSGGDTTNPINLSNTTDNYDVTLTDPGTYTFYVEVEYTVKTDDASRDYVTYVGNVEDGTGNPFEVTINEVPGAPTLTIGAVTE
ncbi:hypothetical protein HX109_05380 [Galbibacter sp. BG1]|uniref:hypothetical protein n=1 Tax=Galbibacter sp. BG1 TaxID=1170699 RepID=UPI0015B930E3|nr:hypothetical protein [Galbibacter sp. BG1]QLE01024.1 hypothetical protein HX109_05380 [Galbibacter sp. BG1]